MTHEEFMEMRGAALRHGWVSSKIASIAARQKEREKEYNHRYYLEKIKGGGATTAVKVFEPITDIAYKAVDKMAKTFAKKVDETDYNRRLANARNADNQATKSALEKEAAEKQHWYEEHLPEVAPVMKPLMRNIAAVADLFVGNNKVMDTKLSDAMSYYSTSGVIMQRRVSGMLSENKTSSEVLAPIGKFVTGLLDKYWK